MLRILIADDEVKIRQGLAKIIRKAGPQFEIVGQCADAKEVMDALTEIEADVLITDIRMPGKSGLDLIEEIRSVIPTMKIIILSGYGDFSYARRAIHMGVFEYLLKPVDTEELYVALNKLLNSNERKEESSESTITLADNGKSGNRVIEEVKKMVEEEYGKVIELPSVADRVFLTASYLSKLFKSETGMTLTDYITGVRIHKAKDLLKGRIDLKTYEIGDMVGYPDSAYFNKTFKKYVGMTPKEYRDS
ncbi:response regulator transcription factor [Gorillibacterium massiliense]|uniref:response regulator transcription factor n=1 Tax=Gorillibacterium massiliense TaxID=1280390 RepID=UPI0004BB8FE8|nr:response regulator [Gorillibacterium massiliense]